MPVKTFNKLINPKVAHPIKFFNHIKKYLKICAYNFLLIELMCIFSKYNIKNYSLKIVFNIFLRKYYVRFLELQ